MALPRVLLILPLFAASMLGLRILIQNAPSTDNQCQIKMAIPKSVAELSELNLCLRQHYDNNYLYMLTLFSTVYIIKQAFCIPGSVILVSIRHDGDAISVSRYSSLTTVLSAITFQNLIAGSLFGSGLGLLLVCTLSSIGVSACYLLSKVCGVETFLMNYFPSTLRSSKNTVGNLVQNNKHQLWYLLLILRIIPITPNWLLNLLAPVFNIPLWTFMYTTFLGLMPYNYICCQSGETLSSINSLEEIFTLKTTLQLTSIAVVMVIVKVASKFCKINT
ncbi:transmembrane protein 41A-like [Aphis craccivora]|uniref:Transmembrane protein 41A-like n=1 Tax=Aphis craccivora TaxID=307492 RepID=A0A6G0YTK3_APHCR|nr:transmembrane protein 41A-like [Aphis craccivora]